MFPYQPETIESAKARLPEALKDIYDARREMPLRPGEQRKHIFDFDDGIRLIVSRDVIEEKPEIHVSASIIGEDRVRRLFQAGPAAFLKAVRSRWAELGGPPSLRFLCFSEKGIPHFKVERPN